MGKHTTPQDEKLKVQFGMRLREAVEQSEKTREGICTELGTYPSQLSRWENGRELPGGAYLMRLPGVLRCDGHYLLTGEGSVRKRSPNDVQTRLDLVRLVLGGETSNVTARNMLRQIRDRRAKLMQKQQEEEAATE